MMPVIRRLPTRTSPPVPDDAIAGLIAGNTHRAALSQACIRLFVTAIALLSFAVLNTGSPRPIAGYALGVAYTGWAVVLVALTVREKRPLGQAPPVLLLADVAVMTTVLFLNGGFADFHPGGATVLDVAFMLVPLIAVFQARPLMTAVLGGAGTLAWFLGAGLTTYHTQWHTVLEYTAVLVVVDGICVLLSWVRQSQVEAVTELARDRSRLLAESADLEERERQALAEELHDGVLQSVLATRQDVSELQEHLEPRQVGTQLQRVQDALAQISRSLRDTSSNLHPAVLEQAGLAAALQSAGRTAAERGGFSIDFCSDGYAHDALSEEHERVLFGAGRELLTNVAKHAHAAHVVVRLTSGPGSVRLDIVDDGIGIEPAAVAAALAHGHLGIASHRIRIQNAAGTLRLEPSPTGGTRAHVTLPRSNGRAPSGPGTH